MKLTVITPEHVHEYSISWMEFETPAGNFVIKRGHRPMILSILPQHAIKLLLRSGKQHIIPVAQSGIVHIERNEIKILLDS
jgi:F0F1-type ATP synthase epsilon subunit